MDVVREVLDTAGMWRGPPTRVLALALVACSQTTHPEGLTPPPPPPSDNPIDVAIWPRLVATGLTQLPTATTNELCRRMALDLIGVTPSDDEVATLCSGKTPEQMARGFVALPRFVETERRFWIRRLAADPTALMADHVKDVDRILDAAATGAIGYDDLVAQLLAHPVMTINRPVAAMNDVTPTVRHVFQTFLGRAPSALEIADYANLLRPWRRRFEDRYDLGYGTYTFPAVLDPQACRDPVLGTAACTSVLLGPKTTIDPMIGPRVPAGYEQTGSNLFYYEMVEGAVPPALQAELEKPGRLLVSRDELWDEIADAALERFLGWWRSTSDEPETVLPEVRRALAEWFRAQGVRDLRELYVVVVTSLLYTTSAEVSTAAERPPWATGPTKLLSPEQLLDSVARILDRELGLCDPHTDVSSGPYWPTRLSLPQPADWYGFGFDFYRTIGQQLGGCLGAVQPPRQPGLPALLTHIDVARVLCAPPSALLPAGVDDGDTTAASVAAVTARLFTRFLARPPSADEATALTSAGMACLADPACADVGRLARETCGALLRSTTFLYY